MDAKTRPTTYNCTCADCGHRFTVTGIAGPDNLCATCTGIRLAAFWALRDQAAAAA
jgi:hypothetical protein